MSLVVSFIHSAASLNARAARARTSEARVTPHAVHTRASFLKCVYDTFAPPCLLRFFVTALSLSFSRLTSTWTSFSVSVLVPCRGLPLLPVLWNRGRCPHHWCFCLGVLAWATLTSCGSCSLSTKEVMESIVHHSWTGTRRTVWYECNNLFIGVVVPVVLMDFKRNRGLPLLTV